MFKYAVRVGTDHGRFMASLVDWPEVMVSGRGDLLSELRLELLAAIKNCLRSESIIRVPKAKPSSCFLVRLSAGEAMKVMVFNELVVSGHTFSHVASKLGVDESTVRRGLNLDEPADIDWLDKILSVMGKRLLAYTVES